jgi:probable selenium-dependent hydroxylase accessory protein YqeC
MNFGFVEPWHLFLPREAGHVISLMGSGGKTSLLRSLAAVCRARAMPVVLTTTTRSEPVPGVSPVEWTALDKLGADALPELFFLHDGVTADGKWEGLAPAAVDELGGRFPERIVLVEVDGAAKLPVKLHRSGEPIWPGRTSLAIIVMGTAAVGSATGDVLHRFGRQSWPPLQGLESWTIWEWDHALTLLLEPGGYLSRVPPDVPCVLALTGLSAQPDAIGLFDFVGRAMADPRLPLTVFCDFGADPPIFRTACRRDGGQA